MLSSWQVDRKLGEEILREGMISVSGRHIKPEVDLDDVTYGRISRRKNIFPSEMLR